MVKRIRLAAFLLGFASLSLSAAVYKCTVNGVDTYSQDTCGEDAQPINISPPPKINSDRDGLSLDALAEECIAYFKLAGDFKDPESIQVNGYFLDWVQDDSGARRVLQMKINARNSYGGYNGGEFFPCYLNHSGTKLSDNQFLINK